MNRTEFERLFNGYFKNTTLAFLRLNTPIRTGDLMTTAQDYDLPKGFGIKWVMPYTVYTEEAWISPRWKGRKNKNERWIRERGLEARLNLFTAQYGGTWHER